MCAVGRVAAKCAQPVLVSCSSGSKLGLLVYPLSFVVTNRPFSQKLQDPLSEEHHNLSRHLGDVVGVGLVGLRSSQWGEKGGRGAALGCPKCPKSWWGAEHILSSRWPEP